MNRELALRRLRSERFDVLIIGGGATGLGCALDAASRGYVTALVEAEDFAKATSSRSTKLIHGGVRYLRQGNFALVQEALHERALLCNNAPQHVRPLQFFIPAPGLMQRTYYALGLKLYDLLAGATGFPRSGFVSDGVIYWDAQFDDARLAIAIARTAVDCGAAIANYVAATQIEHEDGRIAGALVTDRESGEVFPIRARCVVNAAGIFVDRIRELDDSQAKPLLTFSRGTHIVAKRDFLPDSDRAVLVPRTPDGRVVFAVPWHDRTLIGTTDIPAKHAESEPVPTVSEIDYLIETANPYLAGPLGRRDILSAFAGLRPLLNAAAANTSRLSREHAVVVSNTGLVTIAGGKWTTYRKMAQDTIDAAAGAGGLRSEPCRTADLRLSAAELPSNPELQIAHAVQNEMARTVEDVLARRTRTLFLDAAEAVALAPGVSKEMAQLLRRGPDWASDQVAAFVKIARNYAVTP